MTTDSNGISARLIAFVESSLFRNFILGLIVINTITLGLETFPYEGMWFVTVMPILDKIVVSIFVLELTLKLIAYRHRFFQSGWNWFDMVVIIVSVLPDAGGFSVLRALRIMRAFRLFSAMPEMRKVIEALLRAIPGMGAIMAVLGLIFYVSAVMAVKLFGETNPDIFGTLGESAITLFQVMTLEGWATEVQNPVREFHDWAWAFFLIFIILTSFAVLNLFIAIIVDSMQTQKIDEEKENTQQFESQLRDEIAGLRSEITELSQIIRKGSDQGSDGPKMVSKADDKSE